MESNPNYSDVSFGRSAISDDEQSKFRYDTGRWRLIVSRAVTFYLTLFLGLSTLLSIFGIDPFTHNGLMPKALLVFVGLATILALANTQANLAQEQIRGWLALAGKPRSRDN